MGLKYVYEAYEVKSTDILLEHNIMVIHINHNYGVISCEDLAGAQDKGIRVYSL